MVYSIKSVLTGSTSFLNNTEHREHVAGALPITLISYLFGLRLKP